jgi:uncharacterized RDD family membrane protein YckC
MANVDVPAGAAIASRAPHDAGFWKRALALIIDLVIVGTIVSLVFLILAAAIPSVGKMVTLSTPFDIGTVERTIESKSTESKDASGNKVTETDKIIERAVLDRWIYRYRVEEKVTEYEGETFVTTARLSYTLQIDPATGEPIETTEVDHIVLVVLMLYWILADASRYQGSIGKRLLGLRVVDEYGVRLTLAAAAGRNLLKILSTIPALIGFMMAGWTKRKQALHDKIVGAYVVWAR